jgi:hypothetical protein
LFAPRSTPGDVAIQLNVLDFHFPVPADVQVLTSPAAGTLPTSLGIQDVEFIINRIDTLYDSQLDSDGNGDRFNDYSIDRYRILDGGIATLSDAQDDQSAEDRVCAAWHVDAPALEVTKQVRCAGDGDPNCPAACRVATAGCQPCGTSVDALPGSTVEFVINVENTGNAPLAIDLKDILAGVGSKLAVDTGSLKVRHIDGATGAVTMVNAGKAGSVKLCDQFFPPSANNFLTHVSNTNAGKPPICLGVLDGVDLCADPNNPVNQGDRVVVRFKATISSSFDFCNPKNMVDVTNSITARGDLQTNGTCAGLCPAETVDSQFEARDVAAIIDTPRENAQGADDNFASIDVLCRDVDFAKQVRLLPGGTFQDSLSLPASGYPIVVEYRYSAANSGQVDENVRITDKPFCDDVDNSDDLFPADGVDDVEYVPGQCELCDDPVNGVTRLAAKNGGAATTTCQVRFQSLQAAVAFMNDDQDTGDTDPTCYANVATFSATGANLGDVCDGAPASTGQADAQICVTGQSCETAFAYYAPNSTCFLSLGFNRWGWTNGPLGSGNYTFDLYAGAGQCLLSKGTLVGTVSVNYNGSVAIVTYHTTGTWTLNETHLYVGNLRLPLKREDGHYVETVAPGQYPYQHGNLNGATMDTYTIPITGLIYIVAHAETCTPG